MKFCENFCISRTKRQVNAFYVFAPAPLYPAIGASAVRSARAKIATIFEICNTRLKIREIKIAPEGEGAFGRGSH